VRIGAAYEGNVGSEDIELRKRVCQAAGVPLVVTQETVVLIQQFRCVDLTGEYQAGRLRRSKA
jgi:hypothetical protein